METGLSRASSEEVQCSCVCSDGVREMGARFQRWRAMGVKRSEDEPTRPGTAARREWQ